MAIFALLISLTAGLGATLSKLGIGYSVVKASPLSLATSISTALFEPLSFANIFTRIPLAIYPSSAGSPISSFAISFFANLAIAGIAFLIPAAESEVLTM